jgi:hypothetical protein
MNYNFLFSALFVLTIINTNLIAQTNVPSSIINQDVVWSVAGSPYYVNGNLIIENAKLSIDPGVKVIFNSDYSIRFRSNSSIYARGTRQDSILITSTEQVHSGRFIFEDSSSGSVTQNDTTFVSGSIFSYVKFDRLGLVGGYWTGSYWDSYNGNFRGSVRLLFDNCKFTNLISGQFNDPRQYSYDLISHVNESVFNHCEFSNLKLGWSLIGNRVNSSVSIYNCTFSQISKNGYGPLFIQNPRIKIVDSHFSDIRTNQFLSGFYTDQGDSLIVKNSSFTNIICDEQFQYLNHPIVKFENVLLSNITSPELIRKGGLNEIYTVENSTFDQLQITNYLFNSIKINVKNSNFNLKDGQKIYLASENANPIVSGFLKDNFWKINNVIISDSSYLHGLSVDFFNDVTRNKIFFAPLKSSPNVNAPPISKIDQVVTFQALSDRSYGDEPFDLNAAATSNLPVTYLSSDSNIASISGNKLTIVGAGTVTITALQEGNNDYAAAKSVTQTLTIKKATLTVTADPKTRTYGEANPTLTSAYSGFKSNESASVIDMAPTISTVAGPTSAAGTYSITVSGGMDTNYTFQFTPGTLTVTKATLSVKADNITRIYGDANPALTFIYTGFKNNETASVIDMAPIISTSADATSSAGTYSITLSGGMDSNYTFENITGILTVTKAILTAKADDKTRVFGQPNPSFTIFYTGFKNNESNTVLDTAPTTAADATATSDVGVYPITVAGGSDNNYNLSYVSGKLTITKASQTITFGKPNDVQETAGSFSLSATATSNLAVGFESTDQTKLTLSGNTATIKAPGLATVKASQPGNNNYEAANDVTQSFCILPKKPVISTSGSGTENAVLTSSTKTDIQWFRNGQPMIGQTSPDLQVTESGSYVVRCSVDGCSTDSDAVSLIITATDEERNAAILLYPNPVKDELRWMIPGLNDGTTHQAEILDQFGRIIRSQQFTGGELFLSVESLSPGNYFLRVIAEKRQVYRKFIKQ